MGKKPTKKQARALDRDFNGEAGGSLSAEERARMEKDAIAVRRSCFGY